MNHVQSLAGLTDFKFMRGKRDLFWDQSPILLGIAGFDGKLNLLNPAWEKILGYTREELLHRPLCELIPQKERVAAIASVDRLLAEAGHDPVEFGLQCRDGTCRWFQWHRRFDSENQAIFIAGYDMTERKSRERASALRSYEQADRTIKPTAASERRLHEQSKSASPAN